MRGCFKLTFFSSNTMGISEQGRKVIQGQHPTAALPSFFAEMRNHFPVTTAATNMLLLAKRAPNKCQAEKIWPDPMKLENCTVQKPLYTLWG